jgi:hypothetical protein
MGGLNGNIGVSLVELSYVILMEGDVVGVNVFRPDAKSYNRLGTTPPLPVPAGKQQGRAEYQYRRNRDQSFHSFLLGSKNYPAFYSGFKDRDHYITALKSLSNFFRHFFRNVNISRPPLSMRRKFPQKHEYSKNLPKKASKNPVSPPI